MKLLRLCVVACVIGLALSGAGCGGEPPGAASVVESASSPLTSSQIYQAPNGSPGLFNNYTYQCNGQTWHGRQFVSQWSYRPFITSALRYATLMTDDAVNSANSAFNEIQLVCPSVDMNNFSTYLGNSAAISCQVWAHPAGYTGWTLALQTSIPAGALLYEPKGTGGWANGYWAFEIAIPSTYTSPLWGDGGGVNCFPLGSTPWFYAL